MTDQILSIDQGTTSSRAIVFDPSGAPLRQSQYELTQYYPADGWVEHDPVEIWQTTIQAVQDVVAESSALIRVAGIANQRETTVVWDRASGEAIYNAIVWQDRRTADSCDVIREAGHGDTITDKTGLLLDPYFSATKICWILDHVDGARERAGRGELAFGTVDSWLIWHLTRGSVHATDATNASRTMLFNIHTQKWDDELLTIFNIPRTLLPSVHDCAADYGCIASGVITEDSVAIPVGGVAGDQQAALFGQACFSEGMIKSTCGTGCFMIMNTGDTPVSSDNRLLTTTGFRLNGKVSYALEGSIFNAGTAVQWLRDGLKLIEHVDQIEALVQATDGNSGVYMVPAFTGLGAPHWNSHARGAIVGITRDTGIAHFVRAALEAVCYQTRELTDAMVNDSGKPLIRLRVDGGMVVNDWLLQFLADITNVPVERPAVIETTALGAACLAGLQAGIFKNLKQIAGLWQMDRECIPLASDRDREKLLAGWRTAIARVK